MPSSQKEKEWCKKRYYQNKAAGICVMCRQTNARPGRVDCVDCAGKLKIRSKGRYLKNPQYFRKKFKKWKLKNPGKWEELYKQWIKDNPQKRIEYQRQFRKKHPNYYKDYFMAYKNPPKELMDIINEKIRIALAKGIK